MSDLVENRLDQGMPDFVPLVVLPRIEPDGRNAGRLEQLLTKIEETGLPRTPRSINGNSQRQITGRCNRFGQHARMFAEPVAVTLGRYHRIVSQQQWGISEFDRGLIPRQATAPTADAQ